MQIGISVFYPHEEEFTGDFKNAAHGIYFFAEYKFSLSDKNLKFYPGV